MRLLCGVEQYRSFHGPEWRVTPYGMVLEACRGKEHFQHSGDFSLIVNIRHRVFVARVFQHFKHQFGAILDEVNPMSTVDARVKAYLMDAVDTPAPLDFLRKPGVWVTSDCL